MATKMRDSEKDEDLKNSFAVIDKNGNSFIDKTELTEMMTEMGADLNPREIKKVVDKADKDKDGQLSYEEFVKAMMCERRVRRLRAIEMDRKMVNDPVKDANAAEEAEEHITDGVGTLAQKWSVAMKEISSMNAHNH